MIRVKSKLTNDRALRIIAAAKPEFAQRGFAGARVAVIARAAGVNKQLIFYYFRSKRGLFQAILARGAQEIGAALTGIVVPPGRPLERIATALEVLFDYLGRSPDLVALLAQAGRHDAAPFAPAVTRLVVLCAEGQGLGHVRDDVDPHLVAAQALILMVGYLRLESLVTASAPPLGADEPGLRARWKEAAVRLVVNGIAAS